MAAKKGVGWDGFKTGVFRTKQKAMVKLGKAEETIDVQFNAEKVRFEEQRKKLKSLMKATTSYQKSIREMSNYHAKMTQLIHDLYDQTCPLWNACIAQEKVSNDIDNLRNDLEELWFDDYFTPFSEHLMQYKILKERIVERERRRVDMDRYRGDTRKLLQSSDMAKQQKAQVARDKAEAMTKAYQAMNNELLHDIPVLMEDRFGFFDPLFATLVDGQVAYFEKCALAFRNLTPYFEGVDRKACHAWPRCITESEESAYTQGIYIPGHAPPKEIVEKDYRTVASVEMESVSQNSRGAGFVSGEGVEADGYGGGDYSAGGAAAGGAAAGYGMASGPQYGGPPAQGYPPQGAGVGRGGPGGARGSLPVPPGGRGGGGGGGGGLKKAKALYPFEAEDATELPFAYGDIIIIHKAEGEWWEGEVNGRRGLFPSNYVEFI